MGENGISGNPEIGISGIAITTHFSQSGISPTPDTDCIDLRQRHHVTSAIFVFLLYRFIDVHSFCSFIGLLKLAAATMADGDKLNIDSIIARLLEG